MSKRRMTAKIAVTPETRNALKLFAKGLGTTQDAALRFLLDEVVSEHDPMVMGHKLRPRFNPKFAEEIDDN